MSGTSGAEGALLSVSGVLLDYSRRLCYTDVEEDKRDESARIPPNRITTAKPPRNERRTEKREKASAKICKRAEE